MKRDKASQSARARTARLPIEEALRGFLIGSGGMLLMTACVIGLYLVKSAAGIDLFPGNSIFHDYFYHLVQ